VDQSDFFFGKTNSNREGFPVFVADRLEAVKWKNYKMSFYEEERDWFSPPTKLGVPQLFDLYTDPKEEYPALLTPNGWSAAPMMEILNSFEQSMAKHPPIKPGTPDPYQPPK
jgi:arylsulfatase